MVLAVCDCTCLLLCLQVIVRSLIEANATGLLNTNITNVTAAPLEVQAEASGQEYRASGECVCLECFLHTAM